MKIEMRPLSLNSNEFLFLLFFGLMFLVKGMGLYEGQWPFDLTFMVSCGIFLVKFLQEDKTLPEWILGSVLVIYAFLVFHVSNELGALLNILVVVGMRGVSRKRLLTMSAVLWSLIFALQCFLHLSGLYTGQVIRIHHKLGLFIVRWSMGFTHPNVFHVSYFVLLALLFMVLRPTGKKLWRAVILSMVGNLLVFAYSVSFTGFSLVTLYLILHVYLALRGDHLSGVEKALATALPALCGLFAVGGPVFIKGRLFDLINKALSTRFVLSRYYLTQQPIGLFGTGVLEAPDRSYTIDSSYVYALMHFGIIYFVLFIVASILCVRWLIGRKDSAALAAVLGMIIAGVTEPFLSNSSFKSLITIFIGAMFWESLFGLSGTSAEEKNTPVGERANLNSTRETADGHRCIGTGQTAGECDLASVDTRSTRRRFHILPWGNREIAIPFSAPVLMRLDRPKRVFENPERSRKLRKKILCAGVLGFVIGCLGYFVLVTRPDAVYSNPWYCDLKEGAAATEYVYLDEKNLPDDFHGIIFSNDHPEGKLYEFTGFTADFEYVRRLIGEGLAMTCLSVTVVIVATAYRQ